MDDCIERCCKSSNADVAFMLGSVCFAVKCYSAELCKTGPAMISNIGDLNMNPTLSFLKKKQATMASGSGKYLKCMREPHATLSSYITTVHGQLLKI